MHFWTNLIQTLRDFFQRKNCVGFLQFASYIIILYMPKTVLSPGVAKTITVKIRWENTKVWEPLKRLRCQNKRYYWFFSSSKVRNLRVVAVNRKWLEGSFVLLLKLLRVYTWHMSLVSRSVQTYWHIYIYTHTHTHTYIWHYYVYRQLQVAWKKICI